ncbi:MAG TPA: Ig-like domain-containing protein [Kofleriaceae bacterium]|nr:Ig-like domain-containing protein [Kofleriaceae bacterium]
MKSGTLLLVVLSAISIPLTSAADTPTPRGTYIPRPQLKQPGEGATAQAVNSHILYLNPCWGGCTVKAGWNDNSSTNTSSIVDGTSSISEYAYGQASFDAVVDCVRALYEPFDVEVTADDPGSTPHFEAIVAGRPGEVGMSNQVGGVSPFDCGIIDNAITFTFANIYGGSVQAICETVGQESAHAYGLDHEFLCEDPMTYLSGCGPKTFHDTDADCGEYQSRQCQCGGSTQNSFQSIMSIFGPSNPIPPTVTITSPQDGDTVQPGFVIRFDATDNTEVARSELWINGAKVNTLTNPPWVFNAPQGYPEGPVQVEVRVYDNGNLQGTDSIAVTMGARCDQGASCDDGEACVDGRCVPGPGTPGGLGEDCTAGDQCVSGLCGNDGADQYCAEPCQVDQDGCPDGFQCLDTGIGGVCWPGGGDGGGCRSTGGGGATSAALLGLIALVLFRRRRA